MKNKYNLSLADMVSYGYLWDGMQPLTAQEAETIYRSNRPVYRLYSDDTEGLVDSIEELRSHAACGGIFGFEL